MDKKYSNNIEAPHDIDVNISQHKTYKPETVQNKTKADVISHKPSVHHQNIVVGKQAGTTPSPKINHEFSDHRPTTDRKKEKTGSPRSNILKTIGVITVTLILSLVAIYFVVNFSALRALATFNRNDEQIIEYANTQRTINLGLYDANGELLFLPFIIELPDPQVVEFPKEEEKEEEIPAETTENENTSLQTTAANSNSQVANTLNNQLFIPSLGITTPIVWDSSVDEGSMLASLQNGVAHYLGTAKPGEGLENNTGNVFISGHSSYYSWDPGQYKSIFATLPYINIGDKVAIGYNDKVYVYEVYDKTEVAPENVDVVRQDTSEHMVTLMTCVPVGTNEKRLIVRARFVGYAE